MNARWNGTVGATVPFAFIGAKGRAARVESGGPTSSAADSRVATGIRLQPARV
jgi:hypothetical protein